MYEPGAFPPVLPFELMSSQSLKVLITDFQNWKSQHPVSEVMKCCVAALGNSSSAVFKQGVSSDRCLLFWLPLSLSIVFHSSDYH